MILILEATLLECPNFLIVYSPLGLCVVDSWSSTAMDIYMTRENCAIHAQFAM